MSRIRTMLAGFVAICLLVVLAGCAATVTSLRYSDLDVQNKMSDSIFLDPVSPAQRTVFVQVRNTTDKPFFIDQDVKAAIAARGYQIVDDPAQAHYLLQANVLSVGMTDKAAYELASGAGFGGVIGGATAGALIGGPGHYGTGAAVGGLAVGAIEALTSASTKVNWYAVITDLQVSERTRGITTSFSSVSKQGRGQRTSQQQTSTSQWKKYTTRISSSARRVNLTFEEALPLLRQGITQSIAGVF